MNTKMIVYSILTIATVVAIGLIIFLDFPQVQENLKDCAKEGQRVGASDVANTCCSNLTSISGGQDMSNCSKKTTPGGVFICTNCGDGICNNETEENKCNCPKDCK